MRIGISLLWARKHRTGVETAAFNLVKQLEAMDGEDEYVIYANVRNLPWLSNVSGSIRIVDVKISSDRVLWVWEHLFFLTSSKPREVDLIHFPMNGGVVGYKGNYVLTIHDLRHLTEKHLVNPRRHLLWKVLCKANIPKAAMVITISEHVKQDILRNFDVPPDSIRVIPNGVDLRFGPRPGDSVFRTKHSLPERYVLFVGQTTTNKNIRRAIDAMTILRATYSADIEFIVAGLPGDEDAALKKHVETNELEKVVRFFGYVEDVDLPQLYANASVFLFPSVSEGFGIPPLEAMRCGIPVVAAHASCLPEVLGDAAIWVDPLSVTSIADGLISALSDENIRNGAIRKGFLRAAKFSWEAMARDTVKVYREVGGTR